MAAPSTIALSLDKLHAEGYFPWKTEYWHSFGRGGAGIRKDLWGWCDILAVRRGEVLAVQATTWGEVSKRVRKIAESDSVGPVREAGVRIEVWGWRQVGKTWEVKVEDLS